MCSKCTLHMYVWTFYRLNYIDTDDTFIMCMRKFININSCCSFLHIYVHCNVITDHISCTNLVLAASHHLHAFISTSM